MFSFPLCAGQCRCRKAPQTFGRARRTKRAALPTAYQRVVVKVVVVVATAVLGRAVRRQGRFGGGFWQLPRIHCTTTADGVQISVEQDVRLRMPLQVTV